MEDGRLGILGKSACKNVIYGIFFLYIINSGPARINFYKNVRIWRPKSRDGFVLIG